LFEKADEDGGAVGPSAALVLSDGRRVSRGPSGERKRPLADDERTLAARREASAYFILPGAFSLLPGPAGSLPGAFSLFPGPAGSLPGAVALAPGDVLVEPEDFMSEPLVDEPEVDDPDVVPEDELPPD
jgi:hypothetical protein